MDIALSTDKSTCPKGQEILGRTNPTCIGSYSGMKRWNNVCILHPLGVALEMDQDDGTRHQRPDFLDFAVLTPGKPEGSPEERHSSSSFQSWARQVGL